MLLQTLATQRHRQPATLLVKIKWQIAGICRNRHRCNTAVQQQHPVTLDVNIKLAVAPVTILG